MKNNNSCNNNHCLMKIRNKIYKTKIELNKLKKIVILFRQEK